MTTANSVVEHDAGPVDQLATSLFSAGHFGANSVCAAIVGRKTTVARTNIT